MNRDTALTEKMSSSWAIIEDGLIQIMASKDSRYPNFMTLYYCVYQFIMAMREQGAGHVHSSFRYYYGPNIPLSGADFYERIDSCLSSHLTKLAQTAESLQDENLLQYYVSEWARYTANSGYASRVLRYFERDWITYRISRGQPGVYLLDTLALVKWKEILFNKDQRITRTTLRLIERRRNGETVDEELLGKAFNSVHSLGADVYRDHSKFLSSKRPTKYYQAESDTLLATHNIADYLGPMGARVQEEEAGAAVYLPAQTRALLLEHVLMPSQLVWETYQSLLDKGRAGELRPTCALISRVPALLERFLKAAEHDVEKAGLGAVDDLVLGVGGTAVDPEDYVDALLKAREKYWARFKGTPDLLASFSRAFARIVNKNAVSAASSTKSPELLAKYVDLVLRRDKGSVKSAEDVEYGLDGTAFLFKYLEDKDVFQHFYVPALSKRLLDSLSVSEDAEARMITKLTDICGVEYTQRERRMLNDISLSKDLTDDFKARGPQIHVDFSVLVLGANVWRLTPPAADFIVPTDLLPTVGRFQEYYQAKHSGRKITWLWSYSKNELWMNYTDQKYILMTSSYQMAVLVQFNDNDSLSLDELVAATAIPVDTLKQVLAGLVKVKILASEEPDQYDLNQNFKSKKIRVNINQSIKTERRTEGAEVMKQVDEDRKYVIQATIVRIMKAQKTMKNQTLIQEVISKMSARFTPQVPDIKKAIDTLLEREYMERIEGEEDTFAYTA